MLQPGLLGASLLGELRVVNENELAQLRELVFAFPELSSNLDDRGESSVFSPEIGQRVRVAQRGRIGECSFDLGRPSQNVCESVSERQSRASARLLAELLPEPFDASGSVDETLLACEERMALRADVRVNLGLRGSSLERIAAGALHSRRMVLGMDVGFHANLNVRMKQLRNILGYWRKRQADNRLGV